MTSRLALSVALLFIAACAKKGGTESRARTAGTFEIDSRSTMKFSPTKITAKRDSCGAPGNLNLVLTEEKPVSLSLQISVNGKPAQQGEKYVLENANPPITQTHLNGEFDNQDVSLSIGMLKSEKGATGYAAGTRINPQMTAAEITFTEVPGETASVKFSFRLYTGEQVMGTATVGVESSSGKCDYKVEKVFGYDQTGARLSCWAQIGGAQCDIGFTGTTADFLEACGDDEIYCSCHRRLCRRKL